MKKFKTPHFQCDCCGECCRHITQILPDFDLDGTGVCCHLREDGLCDIYEDRPLICRVDDLWENSLRNKITRKDWHTLNYNSCKQLKDEKNKT